MATQDNLQALFGGTMLPEEMQQQLLNQRARDFATLTPAQQLGVMGYKAGAGVGQGLAQAMGVDITDPAIKRMSTLRALSQGVEPTAEGLREFAQKLSEAGFNVEATQAMDKAISMEKEQSITTKNLREGRAAQTKLQEVGVAEGTREPVYTYQTPQGVAQVIFKNVNGEQKMVPFTGGVDRTTSKTNIGGIKLPEGESEFVKELGKLDAKQVADSFKTREAALGELSTLQKMSELNKQQMTTGTFASGRVAVGNLFNTIGISSNKDQLATANSEQYQKYAGSLLLDKIKKLGTNPSNTDRDFIAKIIPQLENSAQARQELIDYMANKANEVITETTRMEQFARQNRGLSGYTPKVPLISGGGVSTLSDDELIRQIKEERAKKGSK
jgi:hypothetical protein